MTALLDVTTAVADALRASTAPALTAAEILRGRRTPLPASKASGVRVNTIEHAGEALDLSGDAIAWDTRIAIECLARCKPGVDAETAVDPLLAAVWAQLPALTLPACVTGCTVEPRVRIDVDEADQTIGAATLVLRVRHIATAADLTPAA